MAISPEIQLVLERFRSTVNADHRRRRRRQRLAAAVAVCTLLTGTALAAATQAPWWSSGPPPVDPEQVASLAKSFSSDRERRRRAHGRALRHSGARCRTARNQRLLPDPNPCRSRRPWRPVSGADQAREPGRERSVFELRTATGPFGRACVAGLRTGHQPRGGGDRSRAGERRPSPRRLLFLAEIPSDRWAHPRLDGKSRGHPQRERHDTQYRLRRLGPRTDQSTRRTQRHHPLAFAKPSLHADPAGRPANGRHQPRPKTVRAHARQRPVRLEGRNHDRLLGGTGAQRRTMRHIWHAFASRLRPAAGNVRAPA